MALSTLRIGNVVSGENDLIVSRDSTLPLAVGTIYVHGAEGTPPGGIAWTAIPGRRAIMAAVSAESTILSSDLRGNATWGNDSVLSAITAARTYLLSLPGVSPGKVNILAQSMGGVAAAAWAAANPTLVNRMALLIPVINLTDVRNNSGYQAAIDAAYGGTYTEAAYGAAHNPLTLATSGTLSSIPMKVWYGNTDTLCKPEFALQFAAASGAKLRVMGGGHAEETVANIDPEEVALFFRTGT